MQIEIVTEIEGFNGQVESYLSQTVRPAIAAGINAAAELVKADLLAELIEDIDNPTAFTRNSFGAMPASLKLGAGGIDTDALVSSGRSRSSTSVQIVGGVRARDYGRGAIVCHRSWAACAFDPNSRGPVQPASFGRESDFRMKGRPPQPLRDNGKLSRTAVGSLLIHQKGS